MRKESQLESSDLEKRSIFLLCRASRSRLATKTNTKETDILTYKKQSPRNEMKIMASEMAKILGEGRDRVQNKDRTNTTAMKNPIC